MHKSQIYKGKIRILGNGKAKGEEGLLRISTSLIMEQTRRLTEIHLMTINTHRRAEGKRDKVRRRKKDGLARG